jgi:uncharacterized protein with beta-barrel porin domain
LFDNNTHTTRTASATAAIAATTIIIMATSSKDGKTIVRDTDATIVREMDAKLLVQGESNFEMGKLKLLMQQRGVYIHDEKKTSHKDRRTPLVLAQGPKISVQITAANGATMAAPFSNGCQNSNIKDKKFIVIS